MTYSYMSASEKKLSNDMGIGLSPFLGFPTVAQIVL